MRNAIRLYTALLKLYPRSYRNAFGAEMMQTFLDHYTDVAASEGRVGVAFWLATITDEIKNITEQHRTVLLEENMFLKVSPWRVVVSALLLLPLFAVFYAGLVKVFLAVPHPPISGIGFLAVLATLLLLSGVLTLTTSYVLASALVRLPLLWRPRTDFPS